MPCKKKDALYYFKEFENFSVKMPWDCFVYILTKLLGFEIKNKSGSKRAFTNGIVTFTADEPHSKGDDYIYKWDRQRAANALKSVGLLGADGE
jgi:hypothetical protein